MNVGQEVFDFINATDSRQGDSRKGNVRYIRRDVEIPQRGRRLTWNMEVRFGRTALQPLTLSPLARLPSESASTQVSVNSLIEAYNGLADNLDTTISALNEIIIHLNSHHDVFIGRDIRATEVMVAPLWVRDT